MPESNLQTECNDACRRLGIWFYHREKGRTVHKAHSAGLPDNIVWNKGKTLFVELKYGTNIQSDAQEEWQRKAEKAGIPYCICYTHSEFIIALKRNGII